jgi:hypothetical protein
MCGAIALYASGRLVEVCDMPLAGREVDPYQLAKIFDTLCSAEAPDMTVVETQQAMPKQGVSTTFKIGNIKKHDGRAEAALLAYYGTHEGELAPPARAGARGGAAAPVPPAPADDLLAGLEAG